MKTISRNGQIYNYVSWAAALKDHGLYTTNTNAPRAIALLEKAGFKIEAGIVSEPEPEPSLQTVTTPIFSQAHEPKPAPAPKLPKAPEPVTSADPMAQIMAGIQAMQAQQAAALAAAEEAAAAAANVPPVINGLDAVQARELFENMLRELNLIRTVEIKIANQVPIITDRVHMCMPDLLINCVQRINSLLIGPAGSFKTSAAKKVAKILDLPYYAISVGPQSTATNLIGYMDAHGRCVRTPFREAYEHGGVFLLDEMDAGNGGVLTLLNGYLDGELNAFPDGMLAKHKDCIVIATANTYGTGADRQYVGRTVLDAATLNRFAKINWDYDNELEYEMAPNKEWCRKIQKIRANMLASKLKVLVTPRATFDGAKMLAGGKSEEKCLNELIFNGLDAQTIAVLKSGI